MDVVLPPLEACGIIFPGGGTEDGDEAGLCRRLRSVFVVVPEENNRSRQRRFDSCNDRGGGRRRLA